MEPDDLLLKAAAGLRANRLNHALIGGVAVGTWLERRATRDGDPVVRIAIPTLDHAALRQAAPAGSCGVDVSIARAEYLGRFRLIARRPQDQADVLRLMAEVRGVDRRSIRGRPPMLEASTALPIRARWPRIVEMRGPLDL
jgi:hypothetical protein